VVAVEQQLPDAQGRQAIGPDPVDRVAVDAGQAVGGRGPQVAAPVLGDLVDRDAVEAARAAADLARVPPRQAAERTEPQRAIPRDQDRPHVVARQAVARGHAAGQHAVAQPDHAAVVQADPQIAGAIERERSDLGILGAALPDHALELAAGQPDQAVVARAGPQRAAVIDREGRDRVGRDAGGLAVIERRERDTVVAIEALLAARPQIAIRGLRQRVDEVMRQPVGRLEPGLRVLRDSPMTVERVRGGGRKELHRSSTADREGAHVDLYRPGSTARQESLARIIWVDVRRCHDPAMPHAAAPSLPICAPAAPAENVATGLASSGSSRVAS
jgi:hypothetical protein